MDEKGSVARMDKRSDSAWCHRCPPVCVPSFQKPRHAVPLRQHTVVQIAPPDPLSWSWFVGFFLPFLPALCSAEKTSWG